MTTALVASVFQYPCSSLYPSDSVLTSPLCLHTFYVIFQFFIQRFQHSFFYPLLVFLSAYLFFTLLYLFFILTKYSPRLSLFLIVCVFWRFFALVLFCRLRFFSPLLHIFSTFCPFFSFIFWCFVGKCQHYWLSGMSLVRPRKVAFHSYFIEKNP